jgi:cytochrome c oxidase assembly factor CtaG
MLWTSASAGVGIVALLDLLFIVGIRRARANHRPLPRNMGGRVALFGAGTLTFLFAVTLPGGSVLSEMTGHVLLAFAVPPLLLLGVPRVVLLPLFVHRGSRRVMQALTRPSRTAVLFLVTLFLCYLPDVFNATLAEAWLRFIVGVIILATALLFWWPIIEPFPSWERELADLGKLLYLFIGSSVLKALGFILAIVPRPIYALPPGSPPLWGLSALNDQQYAGWLMVVAGTFVLLAAASVICIRMLHEPGEDEEATRSQDHGAARRWGDEEVGR